MKRNVKLEWVIAQNGSLVVRRKNERQMYTLNGNFILVWLNLSGEATIEELVKKTKLSKRSILKIYEELKTHGLTL